MSQWEGALGKTQETLDVSWLAWEHHGVRPKELEEVYLRG